MFGGNRVTLFMVLVRALAMLSSESRVALLKNSGGRATREPVV